MKRRPIDSSHEQVIKLLMGALHEDMEKVLRIFAGAYNLPMESMVLTSAIIEMAKHEVNAQPTREQAERLSAAIVEIVKLMVQDRFERYYEYENN